jgi:hypothetical protein
MVRGAAGAAVADWCVCVSFGLAVIVGVFLPKGGALIQFVPNYMGHHKDWKKFVNYGRAMENHGIHYYEWRDSLADYPTNATHSYKTVVTTVDEQAFDALIARVVSEGFTYQVLHHHYRNGQTP